ncbi:MAG: O-antigen ligase family protein, partial [Anaerolineaceae bacterium]|nr:O-antigen ligase family protein [Anaerolineaceae bacterium]
FLPISVPFLLLLYIANQRRAAFISLAIALVLLVVVLFIDNRKAFYIVAPPLFVVAVVYLSIFWNSSGAIGLPARAIKSVFVPDQATYRDQASNAYRVIENINTGFTVHQKPLTGVGFGQMFYILVPMADISFFIWWQYLPHNSIIWIWLKMGVGGFCAMLFLVGSTILTGTRVFLRMPKNYLRAFALTATLYIIMHFIYAYVDISWDTQSMLFVGAMIGILNGLERIAAQPVPAIVKRWPWQPEPEPEPEMLS